MKNALPVAPVERLVRRCVRFGIDDARRAADDWRFNCGPGALCAVLNLTPDELRPHMMDFEAKGYTNPTLMLDILETVGVRYKQTYRADTQGGCRLKYGLMRVQWAGPWTKPGVPMRVRYRKSHWVAVAGEEVFDVNAMSIGGWLPWSEWSTQLVPWLIRACCPKGSGEWWPTHGIEILDSASNGERSA